jgi:hypothetical protein
MKRIIRSFLSVLFVASLLMGNQAFAGNNGFYTATGKAATVEPGGKFKFGFRVLVVINEVEKKIGYLELVRSNRTFITSSLDEVIYNPFISGLGRQAKPFFGLTRMAYDAATPSEDAFQFSGSRSDFTVEKGGLTTALPKSLKGQRIFNSAAQGSQLFYSANLALTFSKEISKLSNDANETFEQALQRAKDALIALDYTESNPLNARAASDAATSAVHAPQKAPADATQSTP